MLLYPVLGKPQQDIAHGSLIDTSRTNFDNRKVCYDAFGPIMTDKCIDQYVKNLQKEKVKKIFKILYLKFYKKKF